MKAARFAEIVQLTSVAIEAQAADEWVALLRTARWVGVDGGTWWLSEGSPGFVRDHDTGLWHGDAPGHGPEANTSVTFGDGRWAMVVLPLPDDDQVAMRLLAHEAWHAFGQPEIFPDVLADERGGRGRDRLETTDGRTWLSLVVAALVASITASVPSDQVRRMADAVLMHEQLLAGTTTGEANRQATLEITEGIAEYVGWLVVDHGPEEVAAHVAGLDPDTSWTRSTAYHSGVGWAWLLDRHDPDGGWRRELPGSSLADIALDRVDRDHDRLAEVMVRYQHDQIFALEQRRAEDRERLLADYRDRFIAGSVLRVSMAGGHITFNPRCVVPVDAGTLYLRFAWGGPHGGRADAPGGAVVLADWSAYDLPLAHPPDVRAGRLSQPGWELVLPPGWTITLDVASRTWNAGPAKPTV